jgi:hypothetical protein
VHPALRRARRPHAPQATDTAEKQPPPRPSRGEPHPPWPRAALQGEKPRPAGTESQASSRHPPSQRRAPRRCDPCNYRPDPRLQLPTTPLTPTSSTTQTRHHPSRRTTPRCRRHTDATHQTAQLPLHTKATPHDGPDATRASLPQIQSQHSPTQSTVTGTPHVDLPHVPLHTPTTTQPFDHVPSTRTTLL